MCLPHYLNVICPCINNNVFAHHIKQTFWLHAFMYGIFFLVKYSSIMQFLDFYTNPQVFINDLVILCIHQHNRTASGYADMKMLLHIKKPSECVMKINFPSWLEQCIWLLYILPFMHSFFFKTTSFSTLWPYSNILML